VLGGAWLGMQVEPCAPGERVLVISCETSRRHVAKRLRALCAGRGVDAASVARQQIGRASGREGGQIFGGGAAEGGGRRQRRGDGVCFFSSRRRHTRLVSDWSSDVCSSDLSSVARGSACRSSPARRESACS